MILSPETTEAIKNHAITEYPKEACGVVADGLYVPCFNYALDPAADFVIAREEMNVLESQGKTIQMIVHSHPNGPFYPTELDMRAQVASDLPWAIVATDGDRCGDPIIWGDDENIPPVIGREFMHGVTDCYSLVRDIFRLGRLRLSLQAVDWPFDPIELPEFPRQDEWWEAKNGHQDLYIENFTKVGFRPISMSEAKPGDCFLHKIKSDRMNHAGVLIGGGLILHHLPTRLSRREPAGVWGRTADLWLRHEVGDA